MYNIPLAQQLVYHVPAWLLGILILLITLALSISGLIIVRRFISHEILKAHNDVAGFMFATLGVVYAVLLAFMVVIVWQNYEKTSGYVNGEVSNIIILYRSAEYLPEAQCQYLRSLLKDYAQVAIEKEWKTMAYGQGSPDLEKVIKKIWKFYLHYTPYTEIQKAFYSENLSALSQVSIMRRERLLQSGMGLPALLWLVLIFGGIITLAFTFFFGTENLQAQVIMTALLAAIIASSLFIILILDFPFTGDIKISAAPFKDFITQFK
jgi:hypothetical protein